MNYLILNQLLLVCNNEESFFPGLKKFISGYNAKENQIAKDYVSSDDA